MDFINSLMTKPLGKTYLASVGQAGYIIKSSSGQLLAIDLYLSDCVERVESHIGFKRMLPKLLSPGDIGFDVIIATHPHLDHFDIDSIPEMMSGGTTRLLCSVDCQELIKQTKLEYCSGMIDYVKPGERYEYGDFTIHCINCDHGTGAPDAFGVVVEVDGKRICEVGDTCLRLDRVDETKQFGDIDILIAPINGAYGNMNENDCVELGKAIMPGLLVPCHYGMFASHGGSPGLFYENAKNNNLNYIIMTQGEIITI